MSGAAIWEACRITQAGATIFHRWDWLQLMANALGSHFLPLGFFRTGELVGLAPLLVKQRGPYKNANWVPFPYLGPLVPLALLPEALQALDRYQRHNGIGLVQFGFAPHAAVDVAALKGNGYAIHADTTMILALAGHSEQEIWAGMEPRGRTSVRRAQRANIVVAEATEWEITHELPDIMREVFAPRSQPPTYPPKAAQVVWTRYRDDRDVRMAAARYAGKTAAILITMVDGDRAWMWDGGGRRQYRSVNPNALLYWDAICWARERGCHAIDLLGNPDRGIATFKASFGGIETPYTMANRENSRLAAWGRWAHTRATLLAQSLTEGRANAESMKDRGSWTPRTALRTGSGGKDKPWPRQ